MAPNSGTLTLPEVAERAGVQTDTLRAWYRRGHLVDDGAKGWKRFSIGEAVLIICYTSVVQRTKDHELASRVFDPIRSYWAEQADGMPAKSLWLVCYRSDNPETDQQKAIAAAEKLPSAQAAGTWLCVDEIDDDVQAEAFVQDIMRGEVMSGHAVIPTIIPIHDLVADAVWALRDVVNTESGDN